MSITGVKDVGKVSCSSEKASLREDVEPQLWHTVALLDSPPKVPSPPGPDRDTESAASGAPQANKGRDRGGKEEEEEKDERNKGRERAGECARSEAREGRRLIR